MPVSHPSARQPGPPDQPLVRLGTVPNLETQESWEPAACASSFGVVARHANVGSTLRSKPFSFLSISTSRTGQARAREKKITWLRTSNATRYHDILTFFNFESSQGYEVPQQFIRDARCSSSHCGLSTLLQPSATPASRLHNLPNFIVSVRVVPGPRIRCLYWQPGL